MRYGRQGSTIPVLQYSQISEDNKVFQKGLWTVYNAMLGVAAQLTSLQAIRNAV